MKVAEIHKYWVMVRRCDNLLKLEKLTQEEEQEFVELTSQINSKLDATAVGVMRRAKTLADMIRL